MLPLQQERQVRGGAGHGEGEEDWPLSRSQRPRPMGVPQGDEASRRDTTGHPTGSGRLREHTSAGRMLLQEPRRVQGGQRAGRVEDAGPHVRQVARNRLLAVHELNEAAQQELRKLPEDAWLSLPK